MSHPSPEYLAQDSSAGLIAVGIAFVILDTFFVILRVVSQRIHGRPFALSDLLSYIAFIFVIAQCAMGLCKLLFFPDLISLVGLGQSTMCDV